MSVVKLNAFSGHAKKVTVSVLYCVVDLRLRSPPLLRRPAASLRSDASLDLPASSLRSAPPPVDNATKISEKKEHFRWKEPDLLKLFNQVSTPFCSPAFFVNTIRQPSTPAHHSFSVFRSGLCPCP